MHTGNFATVHHALKSAGMDSKQRGCLVTVEERFDARSSKNGQRIIGSGRFFSPNISNLRYVLSS